MRCVCLEFTASHEGFAGRAEMAGDVHRREFDDADWQWECPTLRFVILCTQVCLDGKHEVAVFSSNPTSRWTRSHRQLHWQQPFQMRQSFLALALRASSRIHAGMF